MATRHRPPSYHRYQKQNPPITLHVPNEFRARIDQARGSKSYGAFFRALYERFDAAVDERVGEVLPTIEVNYFCNVCGQPIPLKPESEAARIAIDYLKQKGWGHNSCHQKQKAQPAG